jgi:hypothetical protein
MDITEIPTSELKNDLTESLLDIKVCEVAQAHNITRYKGGSVKRRLNVNRKIVEAIEAELARREVTR